MRRITVIGAGYVGLVTGACFADLGNEVTCIDIDEAKIKGLLKGKIPIYEPGLEELVRRNQAAGRLFFDISYVDAVAEADFIFIAVNTPSGTEGEADLSAVRATAEEIARTLKDYTVIVSKSTVPIGTGDWVGAIIENENPEAQFDVVSNPEFLREGQAVTDFMNPDRIVLGAENGDTATRVAELYSAFNCPIIITDLRTAEMVKYASNAFLATRISFINEIASICDQLGADVKEVARGMGLDKRIGPSFLEAGLGFGGSCFPKDVRALSHMAAVNGRHPQLLRAVLEINRDTRLSVIQMLRQIFGGLDGLEIGILGLSFKPNTDDMREAPSVELIHLLQSEGANVSAFDPAAMLVAAKLLKNVKLCANPYQVAEGSDALIVVTEWNEFKQLNKQRLKSLMRQPVLIDGRNIYDPHEMEELGFTYYGIGRGKTPASTSVLDRNELNTAGIPNAGNAG